MVFYFYTMDTILITGGTGLIGEKLQDSLSKQGYKIHVLTRSPKTENEFKWDITNHFIDEKAFENVTIIIHLAGAGIADERWTVNRKKVILNSRVDSTNLLFEYTKKLSIKLKRFIAASAIGYYGSVTTDKIFTETDNAATDFLGTVCKKWEASSLQFEKLDIPVTIFRTGIVLSKEEGALAKMIQPIITPLGLGKQFMPWIHIEDMCNLYVESVKGSLTGIFNAVAPEYHTNTEFSKILASKYKRPFVKIGVPEFVLKLAFGEMATILLEGSRISSKKLLDNKYQFLFPKLENALDNLSKK